jgi:formylglycine-generating enzyme required for sulfatase activity
VLGQLGDPRPGVCTLPPPLVEFAGRSFLIGSTREEAEQAGLAYERYYWERGEKEMAKAAKRWPENEINDRPVTLAPFALARYPLTNAQYALFIADGGYEPSQPWWDVAGRAWLLRDDQATAGLASWQRRQFKWQPEFWDDARFGAARPNQPVVGVSWYEATAFCGWLTQNRRYNPAGDVYRLPSEAEWEYAARGPHRRRYPWGDAEPDGERANFEQVYAGTTAVGCFALGATPEGLYDLAGNVWEWTGSVSMPYPYDSDDGREDSRDPAKKHFTLRGGCWNLRSVYLRASYRDYVAPDFRDINLGCRLARHPPV